LYTTKTYTCGIGGIEGWYRGIIESFILVALMKYMIFSNPLFLFSISGVGGRLGVQIKKFGKHKSL
jgi:hypothetical protein